MRPTSRELSGWVRSLTVAAVFGTLLFVELRRPLRRRRDEPKLRRNVRNLMVGVTAAATVALADTPVTRPLSQLVERRRFGLLKQFSLPPWLEVLLAIALLDYTLYLWHVAFHKVPFLWRFHQPHHVDLDMDVSTGVRFHFGEMLLSVALRTGQVLLIGVSPLSLSIWKVWVLSEVMFHHSNVRLPHRVERWLCRLIVTPRMHGIHHSIVRRETDSNWSSGLALWDYLHGTLRLNVPQDNITIGLPAYRDPRELSYPSLMAMPFHPRPRDPWRLPDGRAPTRGGPLPPDPRRLLP